MDEILKNIKEIIEDIENSSLERKLESLEHNNDILKSASKKINQIINEALDKNEDMILNFVLEELKNKKPQDSNLEFTYTLNKNLNDIFSKSLEVMNFDQEGNYYGENISNKYKFVFDKCNGFENDRFYIRPYNWDGLENRDCTCGLDDYIEENEEKIEKIQKELSSTNEILHSKNCDRWNINFHHKDTGFKISWYKRPLYGAVSNYKITEKEFKAIMHDCIKSLKK